MFAEGKGLGGARGLTRRPHLADRPVLPVGGNARLGDTLQAKGAFLHHPAPTHGDIRIARLGRSLLLV
jgi:hypothetical protein